MKKKLPPSPTDTRNGLRGGGPHRSESSAKASASGFRERTSIPGRRASDPTAGSTIGWGAAAVLVGIFVWSYWPTITALWNTWEHNEDYSGGKIVPFIALYLIWTERKTLTQIPVKTCWWGLGVLLLAQLARFLGVMYAYGSLEHLSLLLGVVGIVLLVGGRLLTLRLRWIMLFLVLTFPLPGRLHTRIALPLQEFATSSALFGLELLGVLVAREGNVLKLGSQTSIAVAEACSGLRMLTAFVVVAATLAFVVRRPAWQKIVLVLSSIPVAILSNTLRLIVTALLYRETSSATAEKFFHDFAGITMMPFAVATSVGLLMLMKWLSSGENSPPVAHSPRVGS